MCVCMSVTTLASTLFVSTFQVRYVLLDWSDMIQVHSDCPRMKETFCSKWDRFSWGASGAACPLAQPEPFCVWGEHLKKIV